MVSRTVPSAVLLLVILLTAGTSLAVDAQAFKPSPEHSWAILITPTADAYVAKYMCCAGDGASLSPSGESAPDLRIRVRLIDVNGRGVPGFPRNRIELRVTSINKHGDLTPCPGLPIAMADSDTDPLGYTMFSRPLIAGGTLYPLAGDLGVVIRIADQDHVLSGRPPFGSESLSKIALNSFDIFADGVVDLVDLSIFSQDLVGGYDFRSDFYADGVINLADAAILSQHIGHRCQRGWP